LGITHYEPPMIMAGTGGEAERPPKGYAPVYDVDSFRRYHHVFINNEPVTISEKIHGCNSRFKYDNEQGRFHCGSKTEWKREDSNNIWWKALSLTKGVKEFLYNNPLLTLYAEVAGQIQKGFDYGVPKGEVRIFPFDILQGNQWMSYKEARRITQPYDIPWVPLVKDEIPYNFNTLVELAEGKSLVLGANHIREGVVVKSCVERIDLEIGRVCLKIINPAYLNKEK
jgi:RNA ligase (TIGR02306 family)